MSDSGDEEDITNFKELHKRTDMKIDNSKALRFYIRAADTMFRTAKAYQNDGAIIRAYMLYLRYSTLIISELPSHPEYLKTNQKEVKILKENCKQALDALELLKPVVERKFKQLEVKKRSNQQPPTRSSTQTPPPPAVASSSNQAPPRGSSLATALPNQAPLGASNMPPQISPSASPVPSFAPQDDKWYQVKDLSAYRQVEDTFKNMSLNDIGSADFRRSSAIKNDGRIELPRSLDSYPTLQQNQSESLNYQPRPQPPQPPPKPNRAVPAFPPKPVLEDPFADPSELRSYIPPLDPSQVTSYANIKTPSIPPKPVAYYGLGLMPKTESGTRLRNLIVPEEIYDLFLRIADSNTRKNLETCGILCGKLKHDRLYVTTLVIPKQTATSDSCTTQNEEELFEVQDKEDLLTLGWIHTHPSQSCFMSSVDLHTHCMFQVLMPEAIAIVVSPKHNQRGIFRLTDPPGLEVITQCAASEMFHPHPDLPLYREANEEGIGHVLSVNGSLKVFDLR
ncbi:hypothetical protein SmJEL517_g01366 [Synchytrium microbalum]|uniref:MPN domain-containing protein n=1 Tax=Synchytrium microbalum TaxID=1806994 RepID=A0A507C6K1_9FUNG|nr:uncharacterized protein SmJEL517_g01366 [Synchytrium microbalum]TPX36667.1 hypothetical protein SmJEL517_g01366 [Synchytrium microbalum]